MALVWPLGLFLINCVFVYSQLKMFSYLYIYLHIFLVLMVSSITRMAEGLPVCTIETFRSFHGRLALLSRFDA